jgi:hypothetical protein
MKQKKPLRQQEPPAHGQQLLQLLQLLLRKNDLYMCGHQARLAPIPKSRADVERGFWPALCRRLLAAKQLGQSVLQPPM